MPSVYASLPLSGPARHLGRELLQGAKLALERTDDGPVELLVLDSGGEAREERAADAARQAGCGRSGPRGWPSRGWRRR